MKKIFSFLMTVFIVISVTGCSSDKAPNKNSSWTVKGTAANALNSTAAPELSVYYMGDVAFTGNAILEYKQKFPNVKLNQKIFYITSEDDFNKTLSTEILTGGGPDIIVCSPAKDIDSVSKFFSNGAFTDLNELISKDKDFKLSDYSSTIMNAGLINGKREFIPLYFSLNLLHTTESILKESKINISQDCSIDELADATDRFLKNGSPKSKYLFDCGFNFYYLLNCYQNRFLDYKNKKCDFDNAEFRDLLKLYKKIQPVIAPVDTDDSEFLNTTNLLKRKIVAMRTNKYGGIDDLSTDNCFIKKDFNEDMKIIQITDSSGNGKSFPSIAYIAAVSSKCQNKEYAFQFIKVLLSDKIQRIIYEQEHNTRYNPVNSATFYKDLKQLSQPAEKYGAGQLGGVYKEPSTGNLVPVPYVPFSDKNIKRITDIKENMSEPVFMDKSVKQIIDSALSDYLAGKINENKASALVNDKVKLFLNE